MNRRSFITGLTGLLAAPAIVRVASIMPISAMPVGDGVALHSMVHPEIGFYARVLQGVPDTFSETTASWDGPPAGGNWIKLTHVLQDSGVYRVSMPGSSTQRWDLIG